MLFRYFFQSLVAATPFEKISKTHLLQPQGKQLVRCSVKGRLFVTQFPQIFWHFLTDFFLKKTAVNKIIFALFSQLFCILLTSLMILQTCSQQDDMQRQKDVSFFQCFGLVHSCVFSVHSSIRPWSRSPQIYFLLGFSSDASIKLWEDDAADFRCRGGLRFMIGWSSENSRI